MASDCISDPIISIIFSAINAIIFLKYDESSELRTLLKQFERALKMQVRYDNLGPDTDISKPEHFKALYTLFFFCPMVLEFFREKDVSA